MKKLILLIGLSLVACAEPKKDQVTVDNKPVEANCVLVAPECAPHHVTDYNICGGPSDWCAYSCKPLYFFPRVTGTLWRVAGEWKKGDCSKPDFIVDGPRDIEN
jgi:hypothetical protein